MFVLLSVAVSAVAASGAGLPSLAPLVEQVAPAVLAIEVERKNHVESEPRSSSDRDPPQPVRHSEGSGFVISASGRVLTNHHVVAEAGRITARFTDGSEVPLTVIGVDPTTDVALLQLEGDRSDWQAVELGVSDTLRVGDWIVAIGNPLGLGLTVTAGLVSGKSRVIGRNAFDDFLQTDAAINRGNSGGPLFDLAGRVVGMNTAVAQDANDIGFAVPIDLIVELLPELEQLGRIQRGYLGIHFQPLDPLLSEALGVASGIVVIDVYPDKPAARAGLSPGDVVAAIGGTAVTDGRAMVEALAEHRPGAVVDVEIVREGRRRTLQVEMVEHSDGEPIVTRTEAEALGVVLIPATEKVLYKARVPTGVLVDEVFSTGPAAGELRPGDVLVDIAGRGVETPDDAVAALERLDGAVALRVVRGGTAHYVGVTLRPASPRKR